jgi:molecular chaperone GrpE
MNNDQDQTESEARDRDGSRAIDATPEETIAHLEQEIAQLKDSRLRAVADLQNTARRGVENEARARVQGIMGAARGVILVLDHFDLALQQKDLTAAQAVEGLRLLQGELWKSLERVGVEKIAPAVGDAFEPDKHEAVLQQAVEGVQAGDISMRLQDGYRIGDTVLRPAKVAVQPNP